MLPTNNITVTTPAADVNHQSHWQAVLAAILAISQSVIPMIVTLVPPKVGAGIELGDALAPVVITSIEAITDTTSVVSAPNVAS